MIIKEKTNWKKMYDELYEIRIQDLYGSEDEINKLTKEEYLKSEDKQ